MDMVSFQIFPSVGTRAQLRMTDLQDVLNVRDINHLIKGHVQNQL